MLPQRDPTLPNFTNVSSALPIVTLTFLTVNLLRFSVLLNFRIKMNDVEVTFGKGGSRWDSVKERYVTIDHVDERWGTMASKR